MHDCTVLLIQRLCLGPYVSSHSEMDVSPFLPLGGICYSTSSNDFPNIVTSFLNEG